MVIAIKLDAFGKFVEYFKSFRSMGQEEIDIAALNVIDKEVRSYFASRTSYRALIFSAPWGSGKTTLIKRWMRDNTSTSRRKQRKHRMFEPIPYISAFGVQDGAELLARIYAEIVSSQSWIYRMTHSTGKNIYQIVGLSPYAAAQALLKIAVKPKYVIIDDLERMDLNGIKSIFGAINTISEQMGIKTVILCDIEKILSHDHGEYTEKLIKEVIKIDIDKSFAVRNIFAKECSDLPKFSFATDMFSEAILHSGIRNLRHVEKAAQTYRRFIESIKDLELTDTDNFGLLTYGLTAYCMENQRQAFTDSDLRELNRYFVRENQNERIKHLTETYRNFDITQSYKAPLTASLVRNVVVNNCNKVAAIRSEIVATHHYTREKQAEWQLVWHLTTSPREDLDKAIVEQREKIASRTYLNTGVILHVFSNELRLSEIKASDRDYTSITRDAKMYIDEIKGHASLEIHYANEGVLYELRDVSSYGGLGYPDSNSAIYLHFMEISDYMNSVIKKDKQELTLHRIRSLFEDIQGNLDKIDDILTGKSNREYEDQFLHKLEYLAIARQIAEMDAPLRYRVCLCFGARVYKRKNDRQDEIEWLKHLGKQLTMIAHTRDAIDKYAITMLVVNFLGHTPESVVDGGCAHHGSAG